LPDWDVEKAEVSAGRYAVLPGMEGVPALVLKMEVKRNWGSFVVKPVFYSVRQVTGWKPNRVKGWDVD
jgi:hypothetical protein